MVISISLITVLSLLVWTSPAHAYLDPGTGSMIVQGIIGSIAAVLAVIGIYWAKVKAIFSSKQSLTSKEGVSTDDT